MIHLIKKVCLHRPLKYVYDNSFLWQVNLRSLTEHIAFWNQQLFVSYTFRIQGYYVEESKFKWFGYKREHVKLQQKMFKLLSKLKKLIDSWLLSMITCLHDAKMKLGRKVMGSELGSNMKHSANSQDWIPGPRSNGKHFTISDPFLFKNIRAAHFIKGLFDLKGIVGGWGNKSPTSQNPPQSPCGED